MDGPEISFLIRGTNGQIGYISEGLTVPEFFNLVRSRNDNKRVLVDFSPVIDALHQLHSQSHNEAILAKYNVLYNYWLDAKTHTKELVKFHKSEEISKQSNSLISELQLSLQKRGSAARYHSIALLEDVCEIKKDSNIYIDSMLCLVYSKAYLDIGSFKADVVVSNYADFLVNLIDDLYRKVLTSGFYQNSFLKYIAFEQPEELESYLALHSDVSAEAFKLRCLEDTHSNFTQTERWENEYVTIKEVKIQYDSYHHDYIKAGRELRDLLYKARSLKKLVELLKENNIEWEANEQAINSLAEVIHIQSDKYPWLANTL